MDVKYLFYPESHDFSNEDNMLITKEDLIYNVTEDLLIALEDMDISKKDLASRLGKSRSFVTQVLSGTRNMTIGTLSDICFVLGLKLNIDFTKKLYHQDEKCNFLKFPEPSASSVKSKKTIMEAKSIPAYSSLEVA